MQKYNIEGGEFVLYRDIEKLQQTVEKLLVALKNTLDMHKRRVSGFPFTYEMEIAIEEHAQNVISETEEAMK